MDKDYVTIGKIVNTQGHRGYLRILPLTDFPDRFKNLKKTIILLNENRYELDIEDTYKHKNFIVIKFKEIPDMTTAEGYKGGLLQVRHHDTVPLPESSYYIFDIIGLDVYDMNEEYIGKVKDVLKTGANDVYVLEAIVEKNRELLVPALKQVVKEINISKGRMIVDLPEGL